MEMIILVVILLVAGIFTLTMGVATLWKGTKWKVVSYEYAGSKALVAGLLVLIVAALCYFTYIKDEEKDERMDSYEVMVNTIVENSDNLIFYLDGVEVDFDKIDINQYQISYDEESGKVFLTK